MRNSTNSKGAKTKLQKEGFDKERQLRKTALAQVTNLEASNKSMRQTLSEWEARIAEMQKSRGNEQKALKQLESQYKEQLTERNSLLATLWQRLGGIVGSKWVDKVNAQGGGGDVAPSTNFGGFSRNILQCVKVLEDVMVNFKLKCKAVERDLWNDYKYFSTNFEEANSRNIDAKLENRTKRIMRMESLIRDSGKGDTELRAELAKMKAENRSLKVCLVLKSN
jgi:septal ring factor EnvC (AmiA/AmiB activator)